MRKLSILFAFLLSLPVLAAGTVTESRANLYKYVGSGATKIGEMVTLSFVGDASTGSVPNTSVVLRGRLVKVVTNPGSTAPTANYDMTLGDSSDSALDVLGGALANRHTSTTEQVYPLIAGSPGTVSSVPVYLNGTYTFTLSNNSQASATGDVIFYLLD